MPAEGFGAIFHAFSARSAGVTLLLWAARRSLWIALAGWWSHIVIDVFTHSADYHPSPVPYPVRQRGVDSLAWNTPWFTAVAMESGNFRRVDPISFPSVR